MEGTLILKIDKTILKKANKYAQKQGKTLSSIIENYLKSFVLEEKAEVKEEIIISDFIKSLSIKTNLAPDFDYKQEYQNHLIEKYK